MKFSIVPSCRLLVVLASSLLLHAFAQTTYAATTTLIATNSAWRYLANGTDQGVAWRDTSFDDSTWSNGVAKLGFGDGQVTLVGDMTNGFITFYFRQTFIEAGLGHYTQLRARLLRDDGAVVYLNGSEIFRQNMPNGAVNHLTLASVPVAGMDEHTFFTTNISDALLLLQPGPNTVAIEVHQSATNSSDLGFSFELTGIEDAAPPSVAITNPISPASIVAGDNIPLAASASDDSGVAHVEFYANGHLLGTDTSAPYAATFSNARFGIHTLTAVAQDVGGLRATSAPVMINVRLDPDRVTLVANRAYWHFWDRGNVLDPLWNSPELELHDWPCGPAELGYGDGDEGTVVGFGPNANNKHVTTYFRRGFDVPDPTVFSNVVLRVRRDDGVAVYLNGQEVFRDNLPAGLLEFGTLATNATDDGAAWISANLNPAYLTQYENVIAVEIHQTATNSSDISFDLQLLGEVGPPPPPVLLMERAGSLATLSWPLTATEFVLQHSPDPGAGWTTDASAIAEINGRRQVVLPITGVQEFYRLCGIAALSNACQPALIVSQPLKIFAAPGSDVTLPVSVAGGGPYSFNWRKNVLNFPGSGGTLSLANVSREDGGTYDVLAGNACSCSFSCPIHLIVGGVNIALTDAFAGRTTLAVPAFELNVTNQQAGLEPGEPVNPARNFARTYWMEWIAPGTGRVTFDTRGSGQETALAAFSGNDLLNLTLEGYSGPDGSNRTSRVTLNVAAGQAIQIQLSAPESMAGLCLNGDFTPTILPGPQFLLQPESVHASIGSNASMRAVFHGAPGALQWFKDGVAIAGETNALLEFTPIQPTDSGRYVLQATLNGFTASSSSASLIFMTITGPGSGSISPLRDEFGGVKTVCNKRFTNHLVFEFRTPASPVDSMCSLLCPASATELTEPRMQPCYFDGSNYSPVDLTSVTCTTPSGTVTGPPSTVTFHTVDLANSVNGTAATSIDTGLLVYRMKQGTGGICNYTCNFKCGTDNFSARWASNQVNFATCPAPTPITFLKVYLLYNPPVGNVPNSVVMHYKYCP